MNEPNLQPQCKENSLRAYLLLKSVCEEFGISALPETQLWKIKRFAEKLRKCKGKEAARKVVRANKDGAAQFLKICERDAVSLRDQKPEPDHLEPALLRKPFAAITDPLLASYNSLASIYPATFFPH